MSLMHYRDYWQAIPKDDRDFWLTCHFLSGWQAFQCVMSWRLRASRG